MRFKVGDIVVLDPPPYPDGSWCPDDPGCNCKPGHNCHYYKRGARAQVKRYESKESVAVVFFPSEVPVKKWDEVNEGLYTEAETHFKLYVAPDPPSKYGVLELEDLIL